jgi:hypothetical protein
VCWRESDYAHLLLLLLLLLHCCCCWQHLRDYGQLPVLLTKMRQQQQQVGGCCH